MIVTSEKKRIILFLAFAFGLAWLVALIVFLTGGLVNSPTIIPLPAGKITLATVLIAVFYMWSPAVAHILTRAITHEGKSGNLLRLNFRKGWKYWLAAWVLPAVLVVFGAAIFFLLFPKYFDPTLDVIQKMISSAAPGVTIAPVAILLAQLLQGIVISPLVNSLFTFGEEYGWRGYLLPKLMPLGSMKAILLSGVIWGFWHAPIIAMGHNYGFEYPGYPWTGILAMVVFTITCGTFLAWVTLRGGSVWPAVIGHAAVNGIAGIGMLVLSGNPSTLIGPLPTGLVCGLSWLAFAALLVLIPGALAPIEDQNHLV
jgi:membrane protease YdiL (CAAX protease family)